jgi:hypothetical protein
VLGSVHLRGLWDKPASQPIIWVRA